MLAGFAGSAGLVGAFCACVVAGSTAFALEAALAGCSGCFCVAAGVAGLAKFLGATFAAFAGGFI